MNDKLRVLHVLAPMREGGLERVVMMMSVGQGAAAHVAAVVEPDAEDRHPFIVHLRKRGVPVTPLAVAPRNYLGEYRALRALMARLQPEIVHTHGYRADVIGAAAARSNRIPAVSTVHGFTGGGRRNRLYEWVQSAALKRADAVIAVSSPLVERLTRDGVPSSSIHRVPNGFTPLFEVLSRGAARRRLGISETALVAGWVGRLSREKGADVMLDALAKSGPRWTLSVIGDGDELANLRAQAAALGVDDRVTWHGELADAGSLLTAFDAFVLSSRTEGTPVTLLEAMHAAVPIIATRVGGVPDVVAASEAILVPSEEPAALARALSAIEEEPAAAAARSSSARERLDRAYSSNAWLTVIESVYRAVAGLQDDKSRE